MPCYSPLSAWRLPASNGKSKIFFGKDEANYYDTRQTLDLACGQCIGCRLERSRRWAVRIMHEAQLHEANSFLTLTYDDSKLPSDGSLKIEDFQLFMKRLRRGSTVPLRFFHCGEYGEQTLRPHYHACLFGEDFYADRTLYKTTPTGDRLYNSPRLDEAWGLGHAVIGDLTFESAAYVARYCLKKVTNKHTYTDKKGIVRLSKEDHYNGRAPEYVTMSRRPGIGANWYQTFGAEVYPSDSVVMRGRQMMPPPFYDKLLEKADPELFKRIKRERIEQAARYGESEDSTSRRLLDRRIVQEETIQNTLTRKVL